MFPVGKPPTGPTRLTLEIAYVVSENCSTNMTPGISDSESWFHSLTVSVGEDLFGLLFSDKKGGPKKR